MATLDGAYVAGVEDRTGSLTPGKQADVVIIDAKSLNVAPVIDPVAAVVLCADVSNVDTVLVAGQVRKRDGKLLADVDRARADWCEASRDYLLGGHGPRSSSERRPPGTSRRRGSSSSLPPPDGLAGATGLRRCVGGRRRRSMPCTPGSDSASSSRAVRSPRTCTHSRRASTSSTGTAVDRHTPRGRTAARAGRLRPGPGRRAPPLRNDSQLPVRWVEMQAPVPRSAYRRGHLRRAGADAPRPCRSPIDVRDPRTVASATSRRRTWTPASRARTCSRSRQACAPRCSSTAGST